jgi:hypothetical protein
VSRGSATRYSSFAPLCLRFPRKLTHSAINGRIDIFPRLPQNSVCGAHRKRRPKCASRKSVWEDSKLCSTRQCS